LRLLLDTHFIVWLTDLPRRLNAAERELIFAEDTEIFVSAVSIWEIRLKWQSLHKSSERKSDTHPDDALRLAEKLEFQILPITAAVAAAVLRGTIPHRDPFDELLLIQAQEKGLLLLTRDRLLAGHPLVVQR
jgi:PIN domain nuclease of toxin-antitoxin system